MANKIVLHFIITLFCIFLLSNEASSGAVYGLDNSDKVLLSDIQVLNLRLGWLTSGRRSTPNIQLICVGGTAGCAAFIPKEVVQCYNRGSDGTSIQWECKTDMGNDYRFGSIQVVCEGYEYENDPYILRDSCGVRYTIDLTEEGLEKQQLRQAAGFYLKSSYHYVTKLELRIDDDGDDADDDEEDNDDIFD